MESKNTVNHDTGGYSAGLPTGFERRTIQGAGVEIDVLIGGSGPGLLLLHGYPQTRLCWKEVAAALLGNYTLVIPDLRGYGRSGKPDPGENHENYSKRMMAKDQLMVMRELGYSEFYVAGHDRGGRVAYRLALDFPDAVIKLCVLDIVPTLNTWDGFNAAKSMKMWHWFFLAQDKELAEHLINKDPDFFIRWTLSSQSHENFRFDPEAMDDYIKCATDPLVVRGMCEDYCASWALDKDIDKNDYGNVKIDCPTLVIWGDHGNLAGSDPVNVWSKWANDVKGLELPSGHFIPEEDTDGTSAALREFFN